MKTSETPKREQTAYKVKSHRQRGRELSHQAKVKSLQPVPEGLVEV